MVSQISVVINTYNEEGRIQKLIESLNWADEIVVVDDESTDTTPEILQHLKKKNEKLRIFKHQSAGFVEPARNYAISKATFNWILILDADEEIEKPLVIRLQEIAKTMRQIDFVRIPRKNLIFGHFIKHSGWWPDYNIRFFKRGSVQWTDEIHRPPQVSGVGLDLPAEDQYSVLHHSYETITQFLEQMNKYTTIQAGEINKKGYEFKWKDLIEKPLNEFLSRFFALEGYKDGLHGLALSFLQASSFLIMYLKLWEKDKFKEEDVTLLDLKDQKKLSVEAINYWIEKTTHQGNFFKKFFQKKGQV